MAASFLVRVSGCGRQAILEKDNPIIEEMGLIAYLGAPIIDLSGDQRLLDEDDRDLASEFLPMLVREFERIDGQIGCPPP